MAANDPAAVSVTFTLRDSATKLRLPGLPVRCVQTTFLVTTLAISDAQGNVTFALLTGGRCRIFFNVMTTQSGPSGLYLSTALTINSVTPTQPNQDVLLVPVTPPRDDAGLLVFDPVAEVGVANCFLTGDAVTGDDPQSGTTDSRGLVTFSLKIGVTYQFFVNPYALPNPLLTYDQIDDTELNVTIAANPN